ncbi:MAG: DUF1090 domain-containing protein [Comamonadaceae bacterium]|nr:MAG: DUF1090 domain-containing protein [Comamonadaceae bacterium]
MLRAGGPCGPCFIVHEGVPMKALVLGSACVLALFTAAAGAAAPPSAACAAKRVEIEQQISQAKANGRSQEVKGLQRALKANQSNCSDASLARERDARIAKAEREVAQRERDLAKAERESDGKKTERRRAKLEEAKAELAAARKPVTP